MNAFSAGILHTAVLRARTAPQPQPTLVVQLLEHIEWLDRQIVMLEQQLARSGQNIPDPPATPTISDIIRATAEHFCLPRESILVKNRRALTVIPRQIAMYLASIVTFKSSAAIGRAFAGRDHTTVLYAITKIAKLRLENDKISQAIDEIQKRITARAWDQMWAKPFDHPERL